MTSTLRALPLSAALLGLLACSAGPPDDGRVTAAAETTCSGAAGTFHDQAFVVGGDTRHYYLHVPPAYSCGDGKAWPLLVDFHGTGFGGENDAVEESWATDEMVSAADDLGFIVVRPRSLSTQSEGGYLFQWDIRPEDIGKNRAFAEALVADLQSRYRIDAARTYASGFSNGPTMASQFLGDAAPTFHGYILVAGGLNDDLASAVSLAAADATGRPRVYTTTGYRDYMLSSQYRLLDYLDAHGLPPTRLWRRESDTGHELYGWHFREGFQWVDRALRPAASPLAASWSRDASFTARESLTEIRRGPHGMLHAVGANGSVYRRGTDGAWTRTAGVTTGLFKDAYALSDICFTDDGHGFVTGGVSMLESADGGDNWTLAAAPPEFGTQQFGYEHTTTVGCGGDRVVAGGVWSASTLTVPSKTWTQASLASDGYAAFLTSVRKAPNGTWLGIGYWNYVGRSTDGVTFTALTLPVTIQWYNGIASAPNARFWVVGEKGTILASADDGLSWQVQAAPRGEDLYAVAFADDGLRGMAVGAHGTALRTADGGATWIDDSTDLDGFLGGVEWLDDHTVAAVGEDGVLLRRSL